MVALLAIQIISAKARDKALSREQEEIRAYKFEITEDITITFKGILCNIKDGKGKLVKKLGTEDRQVIREVLTRYKYYIIRAQIKFKKKQ